MAEWQSVTSHQEGAWLQMTEILTLKDVQKRPFLDELAKQAILSSLGMENEFFLWVIMCVYNRNDDKTLGSILTKFCT